MLLPETLTRRSVALGLLASGLVALCFADLEIAAHDPWAVLGRLLDGLLHPDLGAVDQLGMAVLWTLSFAIAGLALGAAAGLACAPFYHLAGLRALLVALRSVHELFWALFLMQVTGLSAWTGVLAIALPYAGFFAKVFAELMDEADRRPAEALPPGVDALSRFAFARAPLVAGDMWSYTLYRLECALRSSAVLGFIGLPTLGFQLDAFFRIGNYGAVSAVLLCYVAMVLSLRLWMRPALVPVWILAAIACLSSLGTPPMIDGALWRFLSQDILPAPLRNGGGLPELLDWLRPIVTTQILPGALITLVVAQIALVLSGALALVSCPAALIPVAGVPVALAGRGLLILLRTIPEYMLGYILLQIFGPSMLPAVLALAIHNGAVIGHLLRREADPVIANLRRDAPRGLTLWAYELQPRLFGRFVALGLYRWEMILRETAVMGLLGVATLGFHLDMALALLQLDRAVVLVLAIILLAALVDALSRGLRRRLGAGRLRSEGAATNKGHRPQADDAPKTT